MKQTSYQYKTTMLSLASEWSDYFGGPAPTSPVHSDDEDGSSCCSPEPLSPPRSPTSPLNYHDSRGALPELPSLSLSPRSVVDGDDGSRDDLNDSGSSWMCVYDLDTLCSAGDMSFDMNPASLLEESIMQRTSSLMPYVVDLLNPTLEHSEQEEKKEEEHDHTPLHDFHQPLEPDRSSSSSSSSLPAPQKRRKRKRRRSKSRHRINLDSGRSVLVESLCDTVREEEDMEQIEVIYLLVRSAYLVGRFPAHFCSHFSLFFVF